MAPISDNVDSLYKGKNIYSSMESCGGDVLWMEMPMSITITEKHVILKIIIFYTNAKICIFSDIFLNVGPAHT